RLANGESDYPEIKLASLANRLAPQAVPDPAKGKGESAGSPPGMPGVPGVFSGAAGKRAPFGRPRARLLPTFSTADRLTENQAFKNLPPDVVDQLTAGAGGKFNWFSPYGTFADEDLTKVDEFNKGTNPEAVRPPVAGGGGGLKK